MWDIGVPKKLDLAETIEGWRNWRIWSKSQYFAELNRPKDEQDPQTLQVLKSQITSIMPEEHFIKVNECRIDKAERHIRTVATEWGLRSKHYWRIDFGEFTKLLTGAS